MSLVFTFPRPLAMPRRKRLLPYEGGRRKRRKPPPAENPFDLLPAENPFDLLPTEIVFAVLRYLDVRDRCAASLAHKRMAEVVDGDESYWRALEAGHERCGDDPLRRHEEEAIRFFVRACLIEDSEFPIKVALSRFLHCSIPRGLAGAPGTVSTHLLSVACFGCEAGFDSDTRKLRRAFESGTTLPDVANLLLPFDEFDRRVAGASRQLLSGGGSEIWARTAPAFNHQCRLGRRHCGLHLYIVLVERGRVVMLLGRSGCVPWVEFHQSPARPDGLLEIAEIHFTSFGRSVSIEGVRLRSALPGRIRHVQHRLEQHASGVHAIQSASPPWSEPSSSSSSDDDDESFVVDDDEPLAYDTGFEYSSSSDDDWPEARFGDDDGA